jgi:hypothetical protein
VCETERWRLAGWTGGVLAAEWGNRAMRGRSAIRSISTKELRDADRSASPPFGGETPPGQPAGRQRSGRYARALHLRCLLRHQPAHQKKRAADEEQPHFQVHVVLQQAGEQADRKDDHSDQLKEAAEEGGHGRSLPVAGFV